MASNYERKNTVQAGANATVGITVSNFTQTSIKLKVQFTKHRYFKWSQRLLHCLICHNCGSRKTVYTTQRSTLNLHWFKVTRNDSRPRWSQPTICLHVELRQCKLFSLWQDYGAFCRQPLCSGVDVTTQQQIVDLHNELRRTVAKGLETSGNPGPQPPAANMQEIVSKIFLS